MELFNNIMGKFRNVINEMNHKKFPNESFDEPRFFQEQNKNIPV